GGVDCSGHGTHVAGILGSATYGVAKGVSLHNVKVFRCAGQGSLDDLIAGIDWIRGNHVKPAVANMSVAVVTGSDPPVEITNEAVDAKVRDLISAGVPVVIAAGNQAKDACGVSPARVGEALTAAASNLSDARASFSNWGQCVDLFAPGQAIVSTSHLNDFDGRTDSGTSMATPHVAGAVALYLQGNPTASPATVAGAVVGVSTPGVLSDVNGSPNKLLWTLPAVGASVSGRGLITTAGDYTWTAVPSGGTGHYTYNWHITLLRNGQIIPQGTQSSFSLYVDAALGSFGAYLTVTSNGKTATAFRIADNQIPGSCRFC
ncbi:MAG: S8 family peptidase, partial [Steroidobacteraceae bacterium]